LISAEEKQKRRYRREPPGYEPTSRRSCSLMLPMAEARGFYAIGNGKQIENREA
jgi:hypothetical protein